MVVDVLGFEGVDNLAERAVNEIDGFQEGGREGVRCVVVVTGCLLADRDGLEVAAEQGGGACEAFALDFGVGWGCTFDPVEERSDMKVIVGDGGVNCVRC